MTPHTVGVRTTWDLLDPDGPSEVLWIRPTKGRRVVVLLGAFDPVTNAHTEILSMASRHLKMPGAFCLTKVLLARPADRLLDPVDRAVILDDVATRLGHGLTIANRGTYLEVGRTLSEQRYEPVFVIGADKLDQLADPAFYEDGPDGVSATFAECRFLVVPREGSDVARDDVEVLDALTDDALAATSATEVRRRVRSGDPFSHLVPPEVVPAVEGYTSNR